MSSSALLLAIRAVLYSFGAYERCGRTILCPSNSSYVSHVSAEFAAHLISPSLEHPQCFVHVACQSLWILVPLVLLLSPEL